MSEIGYCPNKKCEIYNQSQGDYGYENKKKVPCIICGCILKEVKIK